MEDELLVAMSQRKPHNPMSGLQHAEKIGPLIRPENTSIGQLAGPFKAPSSMLGISGPVENGYSNLNKALGNQLVNVLMGRVVMPLTRGSSKEPTLWDKADNYMRSLIAK